MKVLIIIYVVINYYDDDNVVNNINSLIHTYLIMIVANIIIIFNYKFKNEYNFEDINEILQNNIINNNTGTDYDDLNVDDLFIIMQKNILEAEKKYNVNIQRLQANPSQAKPQENPQQVNPNSPQENPQQANPNTPQTEKQDKTK